MPGVGVPATTTAVMVLEIVRVIMIIIIVILPAPATKASGAKHKAPGKRRVPAGGLSPAPRIKSKRSTVIA